MQVGMSAVVPPRQPLVPLAGAAIAGAVCDRVGDVPPVVWWSAVCVACLAWCGYAATCRTDFGGTAILLAAAGSMAGLYHHAHWHFYDFAEVGLYARDVAEPACLVVVVQGSPRHFPSPPPDPLTTMPLADRWEMAVAVEQLRQGRAWQRVSGQGTIVFEGVPPPLRPGDRLRARGMLVAARPPLNPGESDARLYDRAVRRLVRLVVAGGHAVEVLERGSRWTGAWWLDAARQRGVALLRQYVDARQAGLAAAVLLGSREQVDADVNQDFLTTGTSHLLSISGLHVGILAYGLWAAGRSGWFHRRLALWGAMGFVTAYAALTFAEPPVVRAAVLISVICLARLCGRQALSFNTLAVAGLIVFAQNPAAIFQAGTQLSFLAVAVITRLSHPDAPAGELDPLERLIRTTRPWPQRALRRLAETMGQSLVLSWSIWIVSLPLVWFRFHVLSPIAIGLNPLVCLPMSVALFAGLGVLGFGAWLPPAARLCGWLCGGSLQLMEWCIELALRVPASHVWGPAPGGWWVACFYAGWLGALAVPALRPRARWRWAIVLAWMALGTWVSFGPGGRDSDQPGKLVCTFIAVGHGTSVLVEFPGGRTLLYDAGRLGRPAMAGRPIAAVLWSRGITHLDAVVVSHADADHFNALPYLLERFTVGAVYGPPTLFSEPQGAVAALQAALEKRRLATQPLVRGDRLIPRDDAAVEAWHPPATGLVGSDNAHSAVLALEYGGHRVLLPGDLESPGLERMLALPARPCEILMAPHHGSTGSDPSGMARWARPRVVVVSGGRGRDFRAVRQVYESVGARVLHTAYDGAVQVTLHVAAPPTLRAHAEAAQGKTRRRR